MCWVERTPSWPPWLIEFANLEQRPILQWSTWRSRRWNGERKEIQEEVEGKSRPFWRALRRSLGLGAVKSTAAGESTAPQSLPGILKELPSLLHAVFLPTTHSDSPASVLGVLAVSTCWNAGTCNILESALEGKAKGLLHWYVSEFRVRTHRKTSCLPRSGSTFSCLG